MIFLRYFKSVLRGNFERRNEGYEKYYCYFINKLSRFYYYTMSKIHTQIYLCLKQVI